MIEIFFWFIGSYNLFGALVMAACFSEKIGDLVLARVLQITSRPYRHGDHGALWVLSAAFLTAFLGLINLLAVGWEAKARADLAIADAVAYGLMLGPVFAGMRSLRYVKAGLWACVVLWFAQIAWAIEVWRRLELAS